MEKAGGQSCEELLTSPDHVKATVQLGNLSATMGDLANALRHAGYHHEALIVSEKSLSIAERVGDQYAASAGHHRCASILMDAGLLHEADTRFEVAVAVARQTGNKGLEGLTLQRQSGLAIHRNQLERASGLCQRGPDVEEALAQLDKGPAPFPDFAGFLRQIAAGQLTAIPGGLPEELRGWLEELVEAIRKGS